MIVDLGEHEVTGQGQSLRRINSSSIDTEGGFAGALEAWQNAKLVYEPVVIKFSIGNSGVVRIAKEVVNPVNSE